MKEMCGVKEAASNLWLSKQHARYFLVRGQLKGKRSRGDWAILSLAYKHRRRPERTKGGE
jgi:hypothetical protein